MGLAQMRTDDTIRQRQVWEICPAMRPELWRPNHIDNRIGIAALCAINSADALNGFELAVRAFENRMQSADELIQKTVQHLMKVQIATPIIYQARCDTGLIGQKINEFPADALEIGAHI